MKISNARTAVCALIAAVSLSTCAVTAGAATYGSDPGYTAPASPASSTDSGTSTETTVSIVSENAVSDAIAEAVSGGDEEAVIPVSEDDSGKITVREDAVAQIAKSTVPVTFEVEDKDYSITIDPNTITSVNPINIAMEISRPQEVRKVSGVEVPSGSLTIEPEQKGSFGMTLTINLPAKSISGMRTSRLSLYYISDSGRVTKMNSSLTINADGSVAVSISHASAYFLSDQNVAYDSSDDDDDDDGLLDDDGDDLEDITLIDDDDDDADFDNGKSPDDTDLITNSGNEDDPNPGTGVTVALGALTVSAAAMILFSGKKKK